MPKVLSYTPEWLSRPSPGFDVFTGALLSPARANGKFGTEKYSGPQRTIARRGTEIFIVVDNQIRWSDLCMLKEEWEDERGRNEVHKSIGQSAGDNEGQRSYRVRENPTVTSQTELIFMLQVLKVPIGEQIHQLIPSPNDRLLAVMTSHTIHIVVLPDSSHLGQSDAGPLRVKTYTLGPTTHVLSQAPLACALWHPLGVSGNCLVTVTEDAVLRMWELNLESRWTFDKASMAIDLRKLVNGTSEEDDFAPYSVGATKGFSVDAIDMEVAAAAFGGTGSSEESAWSAATLWIAMKGGDVYALCPLIPGRWQAPATLIPSLATTAISKKISLENNSSPTEEQRLSDQQYQWISELDNQEPTKVLGDGEFGLPTEVYKRPSEPGPIPRLQGPFEILPDDPDEDLELTDIHVMAAKADIEELMFGEEADSDADDAEDEGLSASIVCLMTKSGKLYVCLDLDGVEGQWLPSKRPERYTSSLPPISSELVLLEVLDSLPSNRAFDTECPTFTLDICSRYSFYVTNSSGVYFFSFASWLRNLENELQSSSSAGREFRLDVLTKSCGTLRETILSPTNDGDPNTIIPACIVLQDSDLGYFLLTAAGMQPLTVTLDFSASELILAELEDFDNDATADTKILLLGPARPAYQPPATLWAESSLSTFLDTHVSSRHKKALKEEIRLSPLTLDLITEAHRILSAETHQLGVAAADLFRRCERLQDEFRDQIRRANGVAISIERVTSAGPDEDESVDEGLNKRLEQARVNQERLRDRHDSLRKKIVRNGARELSEKEKVWVNEVREVAQSTLEPELEIGEQDQDQDLGFERNKNQHAELWTRYTEARDLAHDYISQAQDVAASPKPDLNGTVKVPPDLRKAKVARVMGLLERESALVDAARSKLERLNPSAVPSA